MRRTVIIGALAAVAATLGASAASAQIGIEIYAGPSYGYRNYDRPYYGYAPAYRRSYSRERYYDDRSEPRNTGGCGTYRFWNGERCVDARNR